MDQILLEFVRQAIYRIGHLEQLILGLATLGFIGWGFLHAAPEKLKAASTQSFDFGRQLFTIIFSGMIASAFNALFMGRMAINKSLLLLERELAAAKNLPPKAMVYQSFFEQNSPIEVRAVYYGCAAFLPMMSLASLMYVLFQCQKGGISILRGKSHGSVQGSKLLVLRVLWLVSVLMTIGMSMLNIATIERLIQYAYGWIYSH